MQCDEVEAARIHISGDRVSVGGGCDAGVTARTKFTQKLFGAVYKSYARPAIVYGIETWCLKENRIGT